MIRIIDYKKVDMTDDEWHQYQEICKSYDRPNFKGTDLFQGLFESDNKGLILFLRPPKNYTSMEVFLFIMSIFCHQHLRLMYSRLDESLKEMQDATNETKIATAEAKSLIDELKKSRA